MKVKKLILMVTLLSILSIFAIPAHAEYIWFTCTVEEVGPGGNLIYIKLRDEASNTVTWCVARADREKEMLAIALTAAAYNMKVRVLFDTDESHPELYCMYLQP